jgi:GTPase SAR1 family protein
MKLYSWRLFDYDCQCGYNVIAESLEEAREIILYELTKQKDPECVLCLVPNKMDEFDLFTEEGNKDFNWYHYKGLYVIRNWIRDTEPSIREEKKLFRG